MKQKIQNQQHYTRIERLRKPVASKIRRKAADIYIDENHLKHIFNRHKAELAKLGLTPLMLVDLVVNGFNQIYKSNTTNSILLVKWNGIPQVVVIELNFALRKEFYEVKTAFIRNKEDFRTLKLLWKK
ncbi:MAG: hypothetical protein LBR45_05405 [Bacteroidales bacterium]|jgi:hypothetical protein|nr:hypothetical protein [Bacteroidales bacterium]